jgi:hypothetical protein
VEVTIELLDFLINAKYLDEHRSEDKAAVSIAIARALDELLTEAD